MSRILQISCVSNSCTSLSNPRRLARPSGDACQRCQPHSGKCFVLHGGSDRSHRSDQWPASQALQIFGRTNPIALDVEAGFEDLIKWVVLLIPILIPPAFQNLVVEDPEKPSP